MFPSSPGGDHKGKGCDVGFVTGNKKEGGGGWTVVEGDVCVSFQLGLL